MTLLAPLSAILSFLNRHRFSGLGALMLALYMTGGLFSPGLHFHAHHDSANHADDLCVTDRCHMAIYHPGVGIDCGHSCHLTTDHREDCPGCDWPMVRQDLPPEAGLSESHTRIPGSVFVFSPDLIVTHQIQPTGRGPPAG